MPIPFILLRKNSSWILICCVNGDPDEVDDKEVEIRMSTSM